MSLVEQLSEFLGLYSAIALVNYYQNERVLVPFSIGSDHELVDILGMEKAAKFVQRYQGDVVDFPSFRSRGRRLSDRLITFQKSKIQEAILLGFSRRECAKIFGISPQALRQRDKKAVP